MATWVTGHLLALLVGLSLGLIGGGGSILAVPILVYVLGFDIRFFSGYTNSIKVCNRYLGRDEWLFALTERSLL